MTGDDREPMDDTLYLAHWAQIQPLVMCAINIPVTEMLQHIGHIHTVAPILDPTAYRDGMGNLEDQEALLRGLAPFVKAAEAVRDKAQAKQTKHEES